MCCGAKMSEEERGRETNQDEAGAGKKVYRRRVSSLSWPNGMPSANVVRAYLDRRVWRRRVTGPLLRVTQVGPRQNFRWQKKRPEREKRGEEVDRVDVEVR